ncbi:MAG: tRNA (adenosine(37)-N6)-threonylcarbamoyltransferase complex transferase subunit TsaD [Alphaproteobacteria bacterium]|nr:tRNA (adenosine(37)-N6)-threonylcarbamoyltransferase complex transferase subunit TsaD [Alphaproteobacteria bacterium]
MKILGIESSCDDTSASVVCDSDIIEKRILSNITSSQIEIHKEYGGVVPEYAARNHMSSIESCIEQALLKANTSINEIDAIAATSGPGLIGGLLVGTVTAKIISIMANKPFIAINHLEGHLLTSRLCHTINFPFLLVLASGGHFIFAEILDIDKYNILGQTIDDSAGECLDKVAKMLGMEYPGGPAIEKLSMSGDATRFKFPIPLLRKHDCNVSFSGLKTAARLLIEKSSKEDKADIAASFQLAVVNAIINKTNKAIKLCTAPDINSIVLAGGVAANKLLRLKIEQLAYDNKLKFFAPPINLCSDNAAMIAWAAIERVKKYGHYISPITHITRPRWDINKIN